MQQFSVAPVKPSEHPVVLLCGFMDAGDLFWSVRAARRSSYLWKGWTRQRCRWWAGRCACAPGSTAPGLLLSRKSIQLEHTLLVTVWRTLKNIFINKSEHFLYKHEVIFVHTLNLSMLASICSWSTSFCAWMMLLLHICPDISRMETQNKLYTEKHWIKEEAVSGRELEHFYLVQRGRLCRTVCSERAPDFGFWPASPLFIHCWGMFQRLWLKRSGLEMSQTSHIAPQPLMMKRHYSEWSPGWLSAVKLHLCVCVLHNNYKIKA